jgi:hypothetical protein
LTRIVSVYRNNPCWLEILKCAGALRYSTIGDELNADKNFSK